MHKGGLSNKKILKRKRKLRK